MLFNTENMLSKLQWFFWSLDDKLHQSALESKCDITTTMSNTDTGCEEDQLKPLQTSTVTAVKIAECLTSFWLQFHQDSFYLFV